MKMVSDPKNQVRPHGVHQIQTKRRTHGKARGSEPAAGTRREDPSRSLVLIHAINVHVTMACNF